MHGAVAAAAILFGAVSARGPAGRRLRGSEDERCACRDASRVEDEDVVTVELVSTVHDYPIINEKYGVDAVYRTRTWCDGSKDKSVRCDGVGMFEPSISVRPGQRLRIIVHNDFDERTRELGPAPPVPEDWLPLVDSQNGRYAGLQGCGFVFTGKEPKTAKDFVKSVVNMPGHLKGEFEVTNLHLHGMEISVHIYAPLGTNRTDSTMMAIEPGACECYDFTIPADHPSGSTYWYHPHMHSSAAIQSWSGMAGLIYVPGQLDEVLKLGGLVQDHPFAIWDPHFRVLDDHAGNSSSPKMLLGPRESIIGVDAFLKDQTDQADILYLVNAEYRPTFTARPSEPVRFRVVCATTENLAGFEILDEQNHTQPFWQLGSDGIVFPRPQRRERLVLAGGQREEVVFILPRAGAYRVVSRGLTTVQFFCTGPEDKVMADIRIEGEPWPAEHRLDMASLELEAPKRPIEGHEIVRTRTIALSMTADRSRVPFPQFLQNGIPFNETEVQFTVKAGTAEEWIIMNPDRATHPFHVHVNPFQVKTMYSALEDPAMPEITRLDTSLNHWRDTVIVPPMGAVKIWMRFQPGFKGKTVAHCHFLAHEDTGMIMNFLID